MQANDVGTVVVCGGREREREREREKIITMTVPPLRNCRGPQKCRPADIA
jgi:hypothetical protein